MNLRLFVALEPSELIHRRLAALQGELRRAAGGAAEQVKWVSPEGVHLTLQFLGAVPEERLPAIQGAVGRAAAGSAPLELAVAGAGAFPSARRARVLWAAVAGDVAPLAALVAALGRELAPLGFTPEERPFAAHLTLGRARDARGLPGLAAALAHAGGGTEARWRAAEVVLFRSHLSPHGARYEALYRAPLGR
ncbi:RNA 2',3'-cyclic phosphodiesterase [Anaeromyxobacter diazotrophicus]|uniref:RNA 2',3'-cyclic phosphodiesterase n=1 Tax=Anaeromyxobacter diazotrophicus TaxID=2590199 RepID=A0A7I9VHC8_9BACT|nr:RNA 2',3'-cyclic phosphodiesterase [Anaeromyxobacter diazotrophicus]GEJ55796.1 RNA 2',3'-cyclic phosphodiesterase [Anaeromyxobacter diazotrophicus]